MNVKNLHTICFAIGTAPKLEERLADIEMLSDHVEIRIVYTSKISSCRLDFIRSLEKRYSFCKLVQTQSSKSGSISAQLSSDIRNIHKARPDIRIFVLNTTPSWDLRYLQKEGFFQFVASISDPVISDAGPSDVAPFEEKPSEETRSTCLPDVSGQEIHSCPVKNPVTDVLGGPDQSGGATHILIDYENVENIGLIGTEYLCSSDSVTLFYSDAKPKIQRRHLYDLESRTKQFEAVKLVSVGKNGLDFYIAVRAGQILATNPFAKILIVSEDNGYRAVQEYCERYTNLQARVVVRPDIATGLINLDADRRKQILSDEERVSIEASYSVYQSQKGMLSHIVEALRGTEFEASAHRISDLLNGIQSPRERYLTSLKYFGREQGTKIYRLVKEIS